MEVESERENSCDAGLTAAVAEAGKSKQELACWGGRKAMGEGEIVSEVSSSPFSWVPSLAQALISVTLCAMVTTMILSPFSLWTSSSSSSSCNRQ